MSHATKRLAIALAVASLGLTACGGEGTATLKATRTTETPTTAAPTTTAPECDTGNERGLYEHHQTCVAGHWSDTPEARPTTTTAAPKTTLPPTTTIPARDGSRANPFDLRPEALNGPDLLSTSALSSLVVSGLVPAIRR